MRSSARPRPPAASPIPARRTNTTSCTAAALRIPTATSGESIGWISKPSTLNPRPRTPDRNPQGVFSMSKITPCLWYGSEAEEAANFYVSLVPDSKIESIQRSPADYPHGKAGNVIVVQFTLAGQRFTALNGGMRMEYTNAVSFVIDCADQAEVDRI